MPFSLARSAISLPTALAAAILAPLLAPSRRIFSSEEAAANVTPLSSSMSWTWICLDERNTDSRARPRAASLTLRRTVAVRRAVRSLNLDMLSSPLLLLAFLAEDVFACVFHALALVGLGRTITADLGGDLADFLLVDAGDHDLGRLRRRDGDAFRDRKIHVVAEAKLQVKRPALHRGAVADAGDLQPLLEA